MYRLAQSILLIQQVTSMYVTLIFILFTNMFLFARYDICSRACSDCSYN